MAGYPTVRPGRLAAAHVPQDFINHPPLPSTPSARASAHDLLQAWCQTRFAQELQEARNEYGMTTGRSATPARVVADVGSAMFTMASVAPASTDANRRRSATSSSAMERSAVFIVATTRTFSGTENACRDTGRRSGRFRLSFSSRAGQSQKRRFCREPAELLITTPESLEVMLLSSRVPAPALFSGLRSVIVDEIHAFAGTDRGAHLISVLKRLAGLSGGDLQRIGLSATIGNPDLIARWLAGTSRRPSVVIDPPRPKAQRQVKILLREDESDFVREAARETRGKKSLFFCQSRARTEAVADHMRGDSIDVFAHHGSVSKEERLDAERRFASGTNACIVATSTLELGIDVGGLDLTFQANAPSSVSSFLQRMGRTGRREGTLANMTFLCDQAEAVVQSTALVLLAARGWVESVKDQTRAWPVLVHQLLTLTLAYDGISAERCWQLLSRVPDFRGVTADEYAALADHMKREDYCSSPPDSSAWVRRQSASSATRTSSSSTPSSRAPSSTASKRKHSASSAAWSRTSSTAWWKT
jgi:superfamily II DNA/RNA helicase